MVLTTLAHHIDEEWLHEAYRRTRKDGARGIDGQSGQEYATGLERRLQSLLDRAKTGRHRALPVKRAHIPKGNGEAEATTGRAGLSFDFLGFTIHRGKSLAGKGVVRERTAKNRFGRALKSISARGF